MASICMYTPTAQGGHALYTRELMTALSRHATDELRFELVTSEDLADDFRSDKYPIHTILPKLAHRSQFSTAAGWAVNRLLHYPRRERAFLKWIAGRPDIIGVHFQEKHWLAAGHVFRRLRAGGRKVYYSVHNVRPHEYPRGISKAWIDQRNLDCWRLCDGLFVHTELLATELKEILGDRRPPIYVSPHGTWGIRRPVEVPSVRERIQWKRLLFFGGIRRDKGLDLLLKAAGSLKGFGITIAGEAEDRDYYRSEILPQVARLKEAGVPVDLKEGFTPEDDVPALLARHSAIILPYTPQFVSQSGVAFLALAHDLPVVASEVGGLRDLFNEYTVGTTFKNHTPEALADAISRLFETPGGADSLQREIRSARSHYSWETAAEATIAGYGLVARPVVHAGHEAAGSGWSDRTA